MLPAAVCRGALYDAQLTAVAAGRWHDDLPYLAPEVLEGGEPSPAADCYAFGVIMYEVIKRELVAADIAMQADLNDLTDEAALRWHVARIVDGERCSAQLAPCLHRDEPSPFLCADSEYAAGRVCRFHGRQR